MLVRARLHCFVFSDSVNCNYLFRNGATCARNISEREWWRWRRCSWFMTQTGLRTWMRLNFWDITIDERWLTSSALRSALRLEIWDDWQAEQDQRLSWILSSARPPLSKIFFKVEEDNGEGGYVSGGIIILRRKLSKRIMWSSLEWQ